MSLATAASQRTHPAILANIPIPSQEPSLGEVEEEEHLSSYLAKQRQALEADTNTTKVHYFRAHQNPDPEHQKLLETPIASASWTYFNGTTLKQNPEPARDCLVECSMRAVDSVDDSGGGGGGEEIRELEGELERILQEYLREHDKINLSFYLNEFETGACSLADLLGFLIDRLLITLPNPVIRYRLLVCIKGLYVEPKLLASSSSSPKPRRGPPPYGSSSVEAGGQLDLRLFEATCRRYLLASTSLLSQGRLQELERDELRPRRRQKQAAQLCQALYSPTELEDEQLVSGRPNRQQQQEFMLSPSWLQRRCSSEERTASHVWPPLATTEPPPTTGLLKPALPVASQPQSAAAWKGGSESDPAGRHSELSQQQQQHLPLGGQQEAIVASQANTQGVYFLADNQHCHRRPWSLEGAHERLPSEWPLSPSFEAATGQLAASRFKWPRPRSHKSNLLNDYHYHHNHQPEQNLFCCWPECYESPLYEDSGGAAVHSSHLHDYGSSYGAFQGDNEAPQSWPRTEPITSFRSERPVHDNRISNLNKHLPMNPSHLNQALNLSHHKQFEVVNGENLATSQLNLASTLNNNNGYYYPYNRPLNYNNNNISAQPSFNDLAQREEPLPDCCKLAFDCQLCQLNQVDAAMTYSHPNQQDAIPFPEQQLKAISLNEIYPAAPRRGETQLHQPSCCSPPTSITTHSQAMDVERFEEAGFFCREPPSFEAIGSITGDRGCLQQRKRFHSHCDEARIRAPALAIQQTNHQHHHQPMPSSNMTGSDKSPADNHRSHYSHHNHRQHHYQHHHHGRHSSHRADRLLQDSRIQQKDYFLRTAKNKQNQHELELEEEDEGEDDELADEVLLVPAQARDKLPMSVAEQMKRQADSFVNQFGSPRGGGGTRSNLERRHKPNLQLRRTLKVRIKKSKPILGIAIEGGFNVSGQLLPRIVCVHEQGSAYQCGKLRASDLILEVNGKSIVNMTHDQIARTIAAAYYQNDSPYIEFLIGESVQTG